MKAGTVVRVHPREQKGTRMNYDKYKKEDNCSYPFDPTPNGYCWGYAENKDAGMTDKEIEKELCEGCEFYENECL